MIRGGGWWVIVVFFFFQAEDGIRDDLVTGVQTCALPIYFSLQQRTAFYTAHFSLRQRPGFLYCQFLVAAAPHFLNCPVFVAAAPLVFILPFSRCGSAPAYFTDHFSLRQRDRKSTRLNSSHQIISYAVFCLKKKKHKHSRSVLQMH